jgi:peptidoglycan/LPS O-acetylase OafA/YrhL
MFFALIAFIVAVKFFSTHDAGILRRQAVKRYFRLMPPVLASIIISYVVIALGGVFSKEIGADVNSYFGITSNWDISMSPDNLSLPGAFINGIFTAFVSNSAGLYNTVTWCVYIIFIGSYLTYGFLALFGRTKNRWIFYTIITLLGVYYQPFSQFLVFIAGIIAADLIQNRKRQDKKPFLGIVSIILGVALSAFALDIWLGGIISAETLLAISVFLIIYGLSESEAAAQLLSAKFWKPISNIGFSIILTHAIVLFSLSAFLFHTFYANGLSFIAAATLTCIISAPVIAGVAIAFDRFIEKPTARLVDRLSNKYFGEEIYQALTIPHPSLRLFLNCKMGDTPKKET